MKKQDFVMILILALLFMPFFISDLVFSAYKQFNSDHGYISSFIKFAILASYGEVIGLRIRSGNYSVKGFGLFPRAVVWGILGIAIKAAFVIFSTGVPVILTSIGISNITVIMSSPLSGSKILIAFCISLALNLFFSPVLMTTHKITDTHILKYGGSSVCFIHPVNVVEILKCTDWDKHWGFVLKKTIPFFWIPAHTITFLLKAEYQILFAALLGLALGVILAFSAAVKPVKHQ